MQFARARSPLALPYVSLINGMFGFIIMFMIVAPFLKFGLQQHFAVAALPPQQAPAVAAPAAPAVPPVQKPVAQPQPLAQPPATPLPANPDMLVRELGHAITAEKQAEAMKAAEAAAQPPAPVSYEQRISSWIGNYKVYPVKARAHAMQGSGMLLISTDRGGNVHHVKIEASTGHKMLDKAMLQTIRNASPLPAAPEDYLPGQKVLQFKIPIIYTLQ